MSEMAHEQLWRRALNRVAGLFVLALGLGAGGLWGLDRLDRAFPPPLDFGGYSREVADRHGEPLRIFANGEGRWRLKADLDRIDPQFVAMLIAYEDKRFYSHGGIDLAAMARSAGQWLVEGRVVSGGSTITMQVARLIEPRAVRSISAKFRQSLRALQIERRHSKREILELYLSLAPYGGNLEGVRAASLAWFGREPRKLSLAQAALLVALPQSPEARRPDRRAQTARSARGRVIARMIKAGICSEAEALEVARVSVPATRLAMPTLAAHLSQQALERDPRQNRFQTTLDAALQARLEAVIREGALRNGPRVSAALVAADVRTGEILARVGSAGFLDDGRSGWIDMTQALRSPGSTLKPVIYGLAIEDGLVLPETLISDRPQDFGGYRPANFDMTYQGDVTVREALQKSLNVPAIRLLEALGPSRLTSRLKRAGVELKFPQGERPGLSLGLGGAGITLTDLVQLYANLASINGEPVALGDGVTRLAGSLGGAPMLSPVAGWHVGDILSGIPNPSGSRPLRIAWKTGTSYGYRDAWAVGYDGQHVIGVWVGRADNGAVPGISGANTAGPILFEAFDRAGLASEPLPKAPAGAVRIERAQLPQPLLRFAGAINRQTVGAPTADEVLHIAFPQPGTALEIIASGKGVAAPIMLKLQGGRPPFRLLANGRPAGPASRTRQMAWMPDGIGFSRLTVLDSTGASRSVDVKIQPALGQ